MMSHGDKVKVEGRVPESFCVDFIDVNGNIMLRFNPRSNGAACVVRNAYYSGEWGSEERAGGLPFTVGKSFSVVIEKTCDGFKVAVNGARTSAFDFTQRRAGAMPQVLRH
jgi:hypothetical protein